MSLPTSSKQALARRVREMYNAHPFPQRQVIRPSLSDERFRAIYQEFLQIPLDDLKGKTFLDAGCGTGELTWSWRRILDPSTHIIAVDLSTASVNIARRNGDSSLSQPSFAVNSLIELGLADNSANLVFCSGVLVAAADPQRAFFELSRVLRPGGYMILILYHRYGRMVHTLRRAVIDLIEREDVDRRARLGDRFFGRSMRKLAEKEQSPYEEVLYDQFGLPCESVYSVGDALKWFKQANIEYLGTWPPVEWACLGKAMRFSYSLSQYRNSLPFRLLLKLFPDSREAPLHTPNFFTRATMQVMWAFVQLQLFAISGRKRGS